MKQKNEEFDEENGKIYAGIRKDWEITDDRITDFVRTRIEKYRKEGKRHPNFDDEELEKCLVSMICCIGVGFETYLGIFGKDYFLHILDNWVTKSIYEEIERRKDNSIESEGGL